MKHPARKLLNHAQEAMTKPTKKDCGWNNCESVEYNPQLLDKSYLEEMSTWNLLAYLRGPEGREEGPFRILLKEVLATRPNIPTKAQSKAKRIAKAKAQKNR